MKKLLLCVFGFLLACSNTQAQPIGSILNDSSLGCMVEPNDTIVKLYGFVSEDTSMVKKSGKNLIVGNVKISGVKSFIKNDKNIFLNLTVNYPKDDMKVTKLAFLTSPQHSDDEWGGYYYILEGSEESFSKFKEKHQIDSDSVTKTALGNYKVTCVLAG